MHSTDNAAATPETAPKKPRIAIMGEFSAGKSTLSNLLIGAPSLPVRVTATQLPPVWIAHGDRDPYLIDLDGNETPVDLSDLSSVSPQDTQFIRVFHKTDALDLCDLIDMPGISDPNMSPEVWERVAHLADAVIWCTHATQAWRQSEAAVWSGFSDLLADKSLLLLTRFDKITNERDRQRVLRRVEKETEGLFSGVFPISLTQALAAGDDLQSWQQSGAEAFAEALIDLSHQISNQPFAPQNRNVPLSQAEMEQPPEDIAASLQVLSKPRAPAPAPVRSGVVVPRRVSVAPGSQTTTDRPPRENAGQPV